MKKTISLLILIVCCIFTFSSCTNPYTFIDNDNKIIYDASKYTENEEIDITENLTASQIAEKYINISFTICINQVVETMRSGNTNVSETLTSYGSGFIVHSGGFILTNYHVISDVLTDVVTETTMTTITKTYYKCYVSQDGGKTTYPAKILWSNNKVDMAIIVCEQFADLPAAKLKDRSVYCSEVDKISLLEPVITVGNQKSYHASATTGTISSTILREAISDGNLYEHLIQHNAAINHGNSGGALIDMDGYVIGLNTLGDDDANSLFFAVSIYPAIIMIDIVVENYLTNGETTSEAILGVSGIDSAIDSVSTSPIGFNEEGFYVVSVNEECLINGLQAGDIIIGVELETLDGTEEYEIWDSNTFLYARMKLLYAQNAVYKINRGGKIVELTINF